MKLGRKRGWEPEILGEPITAKWVIGWVIRGTIILAFIVWLIWSQNHMLVTSSYVFSERNVPKTFVGFNIVHVSDLHNSSLPVTRAVSKADPDLILVTGGFVDDNGNYKRSIDTVNKISKIAPTYYVLGEDDINYYNEIVGGIGSNATMLEGGTVDIPAPQVSENDFLEKYVGKRILKLAEKQNEDSMAYIQYTKDTLIEDADAIIRLTGLSSSEEELGLIEKVYSLIGTDKSIFEIVISSDATLFDELSKADITMFFTGSVHGDPDKYPGYKKGIYPNLGTTMVLNGGVGNRNGYAGRFFNFPEIRCITLSDGTIKNENPIEKLLGYLIPNVGTKFDDDGGFVEHRYTYTDQYNSSGLHADP